ncbi:hypothetical protein ACDF64_10205 [Agromyces sp. MMS24-JH15]|uniref:hypothetical protein n=1 Tax=Agromyces sp. MMS24-JH15 TaxID=3243765 RepID=UPI00374827A3
MRGAGELVVEVLGVRFRLSVVGPDAAFDAVARAWSRCVVPTDAPVDASSPRAVAVEGHLELVVREPSGGDVPGGVPHYVPDGVPRAGHDRIEASDVPGLLYLLSSTLTLRGLEARAGTAWLLHACGLALPDGRVLAFAAPSGGGKTTLAAVLGREFGYVSDESVAIELDGRVTAFPKPVSTVRAGGGAKAQSGPDELGLRGLPAAGSAGLRLGGLFLLDRRDDAPEHAEIEDVPLLHGLADLVPQTSYLSALDRPLQRIAGLAEGVGGVRRIRYRDAGSVLPALRAAVAGTEAAGAAAAGTAVPGTAEAVAR